MNPFEEHIGGKYCFSCPVIHHGSIIPETAARTGAWLQARLDGEEPTDSCAESPTSPPAGTP